MPHIRYFDKIIADDAILEEFRATIEKLQNSSNLAELDLKKSSAGRLYTIKTNREDRLLFAKVKIKGKNCLLFLEHIENHDYQKSKYLHNPALLKNFIDKNVNNLDNFEDTFRVTDEKFLNDNELGYTEEFIAKPIHFFNEQFIEFTNEQNEVLKKTAPIVINGAPGSGKSCVASSLLSQVALAPSDERKKILYLSQSPILVRNMRDFWGNTPARHLNAYQNVQVEFKTYDELLRETRPDLANKQAATKADFEKWLSDYKVDESQDFSLLQLKALNDISKNSQIAFCFDTHQSLVDTQSIYPFLEKLFREKGKDLSEVTLPASHRCPASVIAFANHLLDVKNSLTGSADKKEKSRIQPVISDETQKIGQVGWYTSFNSEKIAELQQINSPDFAVITSEKFKKEAKERFPHASIFTPAEIKGLEYKTALLYRIFEDETCEAANNDFSPEHIKEDGNAHRPKNSDEINPAFRPYFNQVFTAMTRVTDNLYIFQEHKHKIEKITQHLAEKINQPSQASIKTEQFDIATRAHWIKYTTKLWKNGNAVQAQEIIANKKKKFIDTFCNVSASAVPKIYWLFAYANHDTFPIKMLQKNLWLLENKEFIDAFCAKETGKTCKNENTSALFWLAANAAAWEPLAEIFLKNPHVLPKLLRNEKFIDALCALQIPSASYEPVNCSALSFLLAKKTRDSLYGIN